MKIIDKENGVIELTIYAKQVQANGKTFTVYETLDENKHRVSVAFTQNGMQPPTPDNFPITVHIVNGSDIWADKRGRYPVWRICKYELVSTRKSKKGIL